MSTSSALAEHQSNGYINGQQANPHADHDLLVRMERLVEAELDDNPAPARHAFIVGYLTAIRERVAVASQD